MFESREIAERACLRKYCAVRTNMHTFTAINAAVPEEYSLPEADANGMGGADVHARHSPLAALAVNYYRTEFFPHC